MSVGDATRIPPLAILELLALLILDRQHLCKIENSVDAWREDWVVTACMSQMGSVRVACLLVRKRCMRGHQVAAELAEPRRLEACGVVGPLPRAVLCEVALDPFGAKGIRGNVDSDTKVVAGEGYRLGGE